MWPLVSHIALHTFKEQLNDGSPHTQPLWSIVSCVYSDEATHKYITWPTGHVTDWKMTLIYVHYEMAHQWLTQPLSYAQLASCSAIRSYGMIHKWDTLPQDILPTAKSLYSYGTTHHWFTTLKFVFFPKKVLPKILCEKGHCHDAKFTYLVFLWMCYHKHSKILKRMLGWFFWINKFVMDNSFYL